VGGYSDWFFFIIIVFFQMSSELLGGTIKVKLQKLSKCSFSF